MKSILCFILLAGLLASGSAASAQAVLTRGELTTTTGSDNKDHDTCVWATVSTADGSSELAKIENGDCGGDDSTEYNDHSTHTITLISEAAGASKDACKGFRVHLWQKTHGGAGHDTWKVDSAKVILYFSDGLNLTAETGAFTLASNSQDDAPSVDFANH